MKIAIPLFAVVLSACSPSVIVDHARAAQVVGPVVSAAGEAIVVDPNRDIDQYIELAMTEGLQITAVTETHIHADYLSGSRELAQATGAQLYLSAEGGPDWQYAFDQEERAILLRDGDTIAVGGVRLQAMHTPGHTPEHLVFLVSEAASGHEPMAVLTGDFVFVGDVGRPDLLENAAGVVGTMEPGARDLYRSLAKFRALPAHVMVWPGHGAGSACGKALGAIPASTVGYELLTNWAFQHDSEDAFVADVLSGQPEPPYYFADMKRLNKEGPPLLGGAPNPSEIASLQRLERLVAGDGEVIDVRDTDLYAAAHVPGTINIPLGRQLVTWAGWLVERDTPVAFVARDEASARAAARQLSLIGLDSVVGWLPQEIMALWEREGRVLHQTLSISPSQLALGPRRTVLDVRSRSEWDEGHAEGALHIPLYADPRVAGALCRAHCMDVLRALLP